jgi:hypothetical protein
MPGAQLIVFRYENGSMTCGERRPIDVPLLEVIHAKGC